MIEMTPDEAQEAREDLHHQPFGVLFDLADRALAIVANMRPEHDHHLEDTSTNGGKYQPYRKTRYVTDWKVDHE